MSAVVIRTNDSSSTTRARPLKVSGADRSAIRTGPTASPQIGNQRSIRVPAPARRADIRATANGLKLESRAALGWARAFHSVGPPPGLSNYLRESSGRRPTIVQPRKFAEADSGAIDVQTNVALQASSVVGADRQPPISTRRPAAKEYAREGATAADRVYRPDAFGAGPTAFLARTSTDG